MPQVLTDVPVESYVADRWQAGKAAPPPPPKAKAPKPPKKPKGAAKMYKMVWL